MADSAILQQRILAARHRFERAGIGRAEAALDADVLARHALGGWERGRLLASMREACPPGFDEAFEPLVARREHREPSGYITGVREFWGIDIEVGRGVLVPRPETELLVDEALARLSAPAEASRRAGRAMVDAFPSVSIADVGTGSGCVAVALARWLPGAAVAAIDASDEALAYARRNAARHGVQDRVLVVRGDLLGAQAGPFDAVVSNPPYVPTEDIAGLPPEIRGYEPTGALDGGPDGLAVIRRLVPEAAARLRPGGWLLFEFGFGQAEGVRAIVEAEPAFEWHGTRADLAGIPRVAMARRRVTAAGGPPPDPESPPPTHGLPACPEQAEEPASARQAESPAPSPEPRAPD
ncbi:MAG TPA: peptide chain release factor N(5)-glutamine methyltransferase [Vicinamibacterales bacterium]|nr:peptide chain release factor N(5)-glutamine methyltransferase [Vicinamibacterales bacterium]HOQ60964.1 peptide chain release factor N(5)-glutamine methyltransferase [Vicinamibacterales bacterium]HPK71139.1 peptide chain release factor N(5)-glutamine methyltransferase [Vicinamibacterales bacterium]